MTNQAGRVLWFMLAVAVVPLGRAAVVTVVDWHGDYTVDAPDLQGRESATQIVDRDGDAQLDDTASGRLFSLTTPMNPVSVDYNTGMTSAVFHGGAFSSVLNNTNTGPLWQDFNARNQGANDDLQFHTHNDGLDADIHVLMLWQQPDFLNGANSGQLGLTTNSFFSLTIHNASVSMRDAIGRYVIRNGSNYYASDATFVPHNGTNTLTGTNLIGAGTWRVYSPNTNSLLSIQFDTNAVSFFDVFTEISAVGFLIDHPSYANNNDFAMHTFTVGLETVPEPVSGLALLAAACFGGRRRRVDRR